MVFAVRTGGPVTATTFSIAKNFSPFPGGRYRRLGPYSGEEFREDVLVRLLKEFEAVTLVIDGVRGTPSSFFDEAFGGLIRLHGYSPEELRKRVRIVSEEDKSWVDEIWEYVDSAKGP
jgi:hypothetical protein